MTCTCVLTGMHCTYTENMGKWVCVDTQVHNMKEYVTKPKNNGVWGA